MVINNKKFFFVFVCRFKKYLYFCDVIGYPLQLAGGGRSCRYQSKALMFNLLDIKALLILITLAFQLLLSNHLITLLL